jgi:hypothetical protein
MSKSLPIPHPEWNELLKKRDALESQIAGVLTDIHVLKDSEPVVIGRYASAFSKQLFRLHAAEIESARMKREIELVQAAINSGQELDYEQIYATLDAEFAEWQARLTEEIDNLTHHWGMLATSEFLDATSARKLREKFRVLARRLHPDLNPSQPPTDAELWHRVTAAYELRDIDELDALEILTRATASVPVPDSIGTLRGTLQKLRNQLDHFLISLAKLRKQWPFDQLPVLDDPVATAARQADLDARIATTEATRDERKQWLNQLLDH